MCFLPTLNFDLSLGLSSGTHPACQKFNGKYLLIIYLLNKRAQLFAQSFHIMFLIIQESNLISPNMEKT